MIYDEKNILLSTLYSGNFRVLLSYKTVPAVFKEATLQQTKTLPGQRTFPSIGDLIHEVITGSTNHDIIHTLADRTLLDRTPSFFSRLDRAAVVLRLKTVFSDEQLFELYMNTSVYATGTVGAETASQKYFGKSLSELNEKEQIFLALSVKPDEFVYMDETLSLPHEKQIAAMAKQLKTISHAEHVEKQPLLLQPTLSYKRAPAAVDRVMHYIQATYTPDYIRHHGLIVSTSINLALQNSLQESVLESQPANVALMVSNPKTGEVVALLSSRNYYAADEYPSLLEKHIELPVLSSVSTNKRTLYSYLQEATVLANDGLYNRLHMINKITDFRGIVLAQRSTENRRVLSESERNIAVASHQELAYDTATAHTVQSYDQRELLLSSIQYTDTITIGMIVTSLNQDSSIPQQIISRITTSILSKQIPDTDKLANR